MILPAILGGVPQWGTVPQWIAAVSATGILAALLKFGTNWRGQSLTSEEAIRDHYAKEVARLTKKLDDQTREFRSDMNGMEEHYRKMLAGSDKQHEECQKDRVLMREDNEKLRLEMAEMHDEIRGLKRQIVRYSSEAVLVLENGSPPSATAPEAVKSAPRAKKATEQDNGHEK